MKLTINNPCQENWKAMSPTEKGKFCTACQKEVTDFTTFSLAELQQFLAQEASSCGRFQKSQLEEFNASFQALPTPSLMRKWAVAAALTAVVNLPSFGQSNPPAVKDTPAVVLSSSKKTTPATAVEQPTKQETVILAGKVYDTEAEEPLPFASILVEGTEIGVATDLEGNFKLEVPFSEKPIVLIVSYIGYAFSRQTIVPNQSREQLVIEMKEDTRVEGHIIGLYILSKKDKRAIRKAARKKTRLEKKAARKNK